MNLKNFKTQNKLLSIYNLKKVFSNLQTPVNKKSSRIENYSRHYQNFSSFRLFFLQFLAQTFYIKFISAL